MSILKRIRELVRNDKPKNEIHELNSSCNTLFENIYKDCRIDFGRELVALMDIKRGLTANFTSTPAKAYTPMQEMLAIKVLELMNLYFKYAEAVVSVKKSGELNVQAQQFIECTIDKMANINSLIRKLNNQFYIKAEGIDFETTDNDLILEAEALSNVLEKVDKEKRIN